MLRHNAEKRRVLTPLLGHNVTLEFRVGRGQFTQTQAGRLCLSGLVWYVVLGGVRAGSPVPTAAIRSVTDASTGQHFGPWN